MSETWENNHNLKSIEHREDQKKRIILSAIHEKPMAA